MPTIKPQIWPPTLSHLNSDEFKTWNHKFDLHNLQFLNRRHNFEVDPMAKFVRGVGSAHNRATRLTKGVAVVKNPLHLQVGVDRWAHTRKWFWGHGVPKFNHKKVRVHYLTLYFMIHMKKENDKCPCPLSHVSAPSSGPLRCVIKVKLIYVHVHYSVIYVNQTPKFVRCVIN